jgi:hypothetical protein
VDDAGVEEIITLWVERRDGGTWVAGRSVNAQLRSLDAPHPEDILFEGYELDDALRAANEALEDDLRVLEEDRVEIKVRPFTRREAIPFLERLFFAR